MCSLMSNSTGIIQNSYTFRHSGNYEKYFTQSLIVLIIYPHSNLIHCSSHSLVIIITLGLFIVYLTIQLASQTI